MTDTALSDIDLDRLADRIQQRKYAPKPDAILGERDNALMRLQEEKRLERVAEAAERVARAKREIEIAEAQRVTAWEQHAPQRFAAQEHIADLEPRLEVLREEMRALDESLTDFREIATRFSPMRSDNATRLSEL